MCKKPGDGVTSVKGRATRTRRYHRRHVPGGCLPEGHRARLVPLGQQILVAVGTGPSMQPEGRQWSESDGGQRHVHACSAFLPICFLSVYLKKAESLCGGGVSGGSRGDEWVVKVHPTMWSKRRSKNVC